MSPLCLPEEKIERMVREMEEFASGDATNLQRIAVTRSLSIYTCFVGRHLVDQEGVCKSR